MSSTMQSLPNDVLSNVFSRLPIREARTASKVLRTTPPDYFQILQKKNLSPEFLNVLIDFIRLLHPTLIDDLAIYFEYLNKGFTPDMLKEMKKK